MNADHKPVDEVRSHQVAERISSQVHQLFANAQQALQQFEQGYYVQGFLVISGNPYNPHEHAWVELGEAIIDPSLPHLGQTVAGLHYFPAQGLSRAELKAAMEAAREDYPEDDPLPVYGSAPYAYYGNVMLGGQDYLQAHRQAEAFSRLLAQRDKN